VNSVPSLAKIRQFASLVALAVLLTPAIAAADAISPQDVQIAEQLANSTRWPNPVNRSISASGAGNHTAILSPHPLGRQTLSVEWNVTKHSQIERVARVYQFDYDLVSTRLLIVSLDHQSVLEETLIDSVHLPLNEQEIAAALNWLAGSADAVQSLRDDQIRRGRPAFGELNELSVKAIIFAPNNTSEPCAYERCALLSLFDESNTVFAMEPVVNLERGTVSWLSR